VIIFLCLVLIYIVLQSLYSGYYLMRGGKLTKTTYTKSAEFGHKDKQKFRLLILGDSVAAGVGASSFETSVSGRVALDLAKDRHVIFQSNAKTGLRMADLLNVKAPDEKQDLILMIISSNDLFHFGSISKFKDDVPKVFEKYAPHAAHIIVVGPGRVFDSGAIPFIIKPIYKVQGAKYAVILSANSAKFSNFSYINPLDPPKGIEEVRDWSSVDKFHPGDNGYEFWFNMVKTAL